jgi:hypothetical protein
VAAQNSSGPSPGTPSGTDKYPYLTAAQEQKIATGWGDNPSIGEAMKGWIAEGTGLEAPATVGTVPEVMNWLNQQLVPYEARWKRGLESSSHPSVGKGFSWSEMPNGKFYISDDAIENLWPRIIGELSQELSYKDETDLRSLLTSPNFLYESSNGYRDLWSQVFNQTGREFATNRLLLPQRRLLYTDAERSVFNPFLGG